MKKIDEIKVDLVNSKWLSFNKIDLEDNQFIQVLSKVMKKDEVVYSIVDGIILLEDKKLLKATTKLDKMEEKQAKTNKPVTEAMQKTMDEVANELANPKRAGKAIMAMTDKRVITIYEDLNKDYKIKTYKRNVEDIMGINAGADETQPGLFNFVVSFGKVVIRMVTKNEQNIKHFEFAVDGQIAMAAEKQIINEESKIVEKEAKEIVKADKAEKKPVAKKAPAKKTAAAKKPAAKKSPVKKSPVKKAAAKKSTTAKKPAAKKPAKPVVKKETETKPEVKKSPVKKAAKPAAKKPAAKKAPVKKAAAPKAAAPKADVVIIGDEDNKSFKKQEKEISKVESKQAKETKKEAKEAFKPKKENKAKPATKKAKPVIAKKAPKAEKAKADKKESKVSFKSIFSLNNIWHLIVGILAIGILVTSAIAFTSDWGTAWTASLACQTAFSAIAIILVIIMMIPDLLKAKLNFEKGISLVLLLFTLIVAIIGVSGGNYVYIDPLQYVVLAFSALVMFDNLFNGIKGFIPEKKKD